MKLADILKDSNYKLSQFSTTEIEQLEQTITVKETKKGDVPYTICLVRRKAIKLTPEEVIRQLYLKVLTDRLRYPLSRIRVEYGVNFGREVKRADIVVMDKDRPNTVYMIVEVKKPKLKDGKNQLRSYCNATGAPIAVWTNGDQISYYQRKDPNYFEDIPGLPNISQTLADILQIKFTLEDLIANDKLVKENKSLKTLIEEMEDEVLANAGVDVFEELFKLIFTKLYDEWYSGQGSRRSKRSLEFRNTGQTEAALKNKIQDLFDKAKNKWEGVFSEDAKISLTPSHLSVCVSSLENVKLFNSNLDVIDEAFEYLINQSSKGDKGQYFTPRYVIDMCVKMLNPQEDEYMIDTAAGSSGFPVHTIFHVWRQILDDEGLEASHLFSLEDKPPRCNEYVEEKVFGIDFDEKAVRVARTLNLIAGDGQTNVLHLNTLDFELWDEVTGQEDWDDVYHEGFRRLKRLRPKGSKDYREFRFDVLMANPPFAGDIKEPRMIARYDLAKKPNGKWQNKVGRDILFIERNLDFLKPGGRMAIVLPQGRFNNSSDKNIRDFIAERCRVLAVVGLHGNTFKPHTGTKTSVLFVQKWNDDPRAGPLCHCTDDYNIFFATMRKTGKDNSGEKIFRRIIPEDEEALSEEQKHREFLLDPHGHLVVDHDLYNHDGMTEDGIAEAFIEFAKKENLSFFEFSPSLTPFDGTKYQQLMDGLEAAEVLWSDLEFTRRLDSEYYRPGFLALEAKLLNKETCCIQDRASFLIGPFGSSFLVENYEEESPYRYVRGKDVKPFFVTDDDNVHIPKSDYERLGRYHLRKNDILISVVGTLGNASIVTEEIIPAVFSCKSTVIRSKDIDFSRYLLAYLNSDTGKNLLIRKARGAIQTGLNLDDLKTALVFLPDEIFREFISKIVQFSKLRLDQSKQIYKEAEDVLLSNLGLNNWQPTEENISVKSFVASFGTSRRLDAEHYQPKFDQLVTKLKGTAKLTCLGQLLTCCQKGKQPKYFDEKDEISGGYPVVNSKQVRKGEVILEDSRYAPLPRGKEPLIISKDDVLINGTGVGTIGRCAPYLHKQEALPDTEVTVLRSDVLDPVYLSVYLNSIAGQLQIEKYLQGSSGIIRVYPKDILMFQIWQAPETIQETIKEKVEESHQKREQSYHLLEIAKVGVEKAIETDEAISTKWIQQQLTTLGVSINQKPHAGEVV